MTSTLTNVRIEVETFARNSDAPAQISPELVLVAPPEEARAAREALEEPRPVDTPPAPRNMRPPEPVASPPLVEAPPSVRPALMRRRSRLLLPAALLAVALVAGGFVVGRQLGNGHTPGTAAVAQPPAPPAPPGRSGTRQASSTAAPQSKNAPSAPLVSWKAQPGIRHYRLDLVRGGAVVLTILTDEPSTRIPLRWPNAGRFRHLAKGTYTWRVRAATAGPSRLVAHGTFTAN